MANRRESHLDALERRLTGPKRIALFGHRAVGKTTLLAMFYREASAGRVPGVRLAAVDPPSAEYLAEKIARIEAGEPPAGTLAETELKLRLYHGPARLDLIVKDYQGEHVALGADDASIRAFFDDCDAVLLCLDPDGSPEPADRRRRQQEVEHLLERYIERTDDATAGRPDRHPGHEVRPRDRAAGSPPRAGRSPGRRALRHDAARPGLPRAARGDLRRQLLRARGRRRRPAPYDVAPVRPGRAARLAGRPDGGEGRRAARMDPGPRARGPAQAVALRPSPGAPLSALGARRRVPTRAGAAAPPARAAARASGWRSPRAWSSAAWRATTRWASSEAVAFERDNPPPEVLRRWAELPAWHPTLAYLWPDGARQARHKVKEWELKTEQFRLSLGTAAGHPAADLDRLKEEAPDLLAEARQLEAARDRERHDAAWAEIQAEVRADPEQAEAQLASLQNFLRKHPDTPHRDDAVKLAAELGARVADRRAQVELTARSTPSNGPPTCPTPTSTDLIQQVQSLLTRNGEGRHRAEAVALQESLVRRLDERDIEKARAYSKQHPTNFATRVARYQAYLDAHKQGGRFVREAMRAKDDVEREADVHAYRQAYDHLTAHPDDVAEVARRLRSYLQRASRRPVRQGRRPLPRLVREGHRARRVSRDPASRRGRGGRGQVFLRRRARPERRVVGGRREVRPLAHRAEHHPARLGLHLRQPRKVEAERPGGRAHPGQRLVGPAASSLSRAARATRWPCATSRGRSGRARGARRTSSSRRTSASPS